MIIMAKRVGATVYLEVQRKKGNQASMFEGTVL